jgi:CubicO group peptidase (beta-lactamase class C family)
MVLLMNNRAITRRDATRLLMLGGCALTWPSLDRSFGLGSQQPPLRRSDTLERMLERVRRQYELPGLAAAVVKGRHGMVSGVTGVRRWRHRSRIQPADRFHIASCTKAWTATLAAIAVQRGQLEWTTTLADGLPILVRRMRKEYTEVTLEQLLAHEGRLPSYTQPTAQRAAELRALSGEHSEQRLAFLARALTEAPNDARGDGAYSNAGYAAAGAMIEQAAGTSWEDLIRRELAASLGLSSVGFGYPAKDASSNQPRGHARRGAAVVELPINEERELAACLWPAGAVHCSIDDLARYAADHLNGLRGRAALLPVAVYEHLHRARGDSVFTLGWGRLRDPRWGVVHFGAGSGGWFFVRIVVLPEHDTAVVVASNSGDAARATRELWPELVRHVTHG